MGIGSQEGDVFVPSSGIGATITDIEGVDMMRDMNANARGGRNNGWDGQTFGSSSEQLGEGFRCNFLEQVIEEVSA